MIINRLKIILRKISKAHLHQICHLKGLRPLEQIRCTSWLRCNRVLPSALSTSQIKYKKPGKHLLMPSESEGRRAHYKYLIYNEWSVGVGFPSVPGNGTTSPNGDINNGGGICYSLSNFAIWFEIVSHSRTKNQRIPWCSSKNGK